MDLPDLKKLGQIIDLCRKKGVASIAIGEMKLEIRAELPESNYKRKQLVKEESDPINPYANFPEGELTPDQLMYYSSGGLPENDPYTGKVINEN